MTSGCTRRRWVGVWLSLPCKFSVYSCESKVQSHFLDIIVADDLPRLLQIMLAVLCFYVPKQKKQIEGVQPPPYLENQQLVKDKDLEADCQSLQYTESQYSVDKPEDPEKGQVVEKEDAKKKAADV